MGWSLNKKFSESFLTLYDNGKKKSSFSHLQKATFRFDKLFKFTLFHWLCFTTQMFDSKAV